MDFRDVTGMDTPKLNSIQKLCVKDIKCIEYLNSTHESHVLKQRKLKPETLSG